MRASRALALLLLAASCAPHNGRPTRQACEACLAAGRVWTGGQCADACLTDVSCFKPGAECPPCPECAESTHW